MRRHPLSLRAVSMKAVVPPSMASPETHARAGEEAWQWLLKRCGEDRECSDGFPTLSSDFQVLLEKLKDSPTLPLAKPTNGTSRLRVSRGLFAEGFRFSLYSPEAASRAPRFVKDLVTGTTGLAENAFTTRNLLAGDRLAAGFFLSVSCTEDVPYLPKNITRLAAGTFGGDYRLRQQINACAVWPRGQVSAAHRRPTKSSIPTLMLSGEFDPVTPPGGGEEVLHGLSRGLHVVIKNNGHPIGSAEQCIGQIIGAFIDKGSIAGLDTSCTAKIQPVRFASP